MRTKDLAELQFDKSAKPISLGINFESFVSYSISLDTGYDEESEYDDSSVVLLDETENIECDPRSIVLLANDLDPKKRDEYRQFLDEKEHSNQSEQNEIEDLATIQQVPLFDDDPRNIKSVDFQIKHSEFKQQVISQVIHSNPTVNAFKLLMLTIERLDEQDKKKLRLIEQPKFRFDKILIDKSMLSVKFINEMGKRYENFIFNKFPQRYKKLTNDWIDDRTFLDRNYVDRKIDKILNCAILSKYISFQHIELNSFPGHDIGCESNNRLISCHEILHTLNFQTMHLDSDHITNVARLVHNFPVLYNCDRLYYLEYLISKVRRDEAFFDSHFVNFSEGSGQHWYNPRFPGSNKWIETWWNTVK